VSLDAGLRDLGDIAVGNVVGSNICNVALILGLAALINPLSVNDQLVRLDVPLLIGVSLLVGALLADGSVGRAAGTVSVAMLCVWLGLTIRLARKARPAPAGLPASGAPARTVSRLGCAAMIVLGLGALFAGGSGFVRGAVELARAVSISEAVIGLTVVAVGTSLPELATSLVGAARGQGDIAIGNIVGSNLFNLLGILGITAFVAPLRALAIDGVDLGTMIGLAILLLGLAVTGGKLSRAEGGLLVAIYVGYTAWLVARA
jgi:cation:H+ antiporter